MKTYLTGEALLGTESIRYYLIESPFLGKIPSFGIVVEFRGERIVIKDLAFSEQQVRGLLERMKHGTVTPVSVRDIVEDWLAR